MAANEPMGTGHRHIHPVPQGRGHSTAQHSPCLCGGPVSPWPMAGTPGTACHAALVSSAENLSRLRLANWKACMHACHCHAIIVSLSPTELREEAQNQKPLLPLMNRAIPPSLSLLESLELNESSRPFSAIGASEGCQTTVPPLSRAPFVFVPSICMHATSSSASPMHCAATESRCVYLLVVFISLGMSIVVFDPCTHTLAPGSCRFGCRACRIIMPLPCVPADREPISCAFLFCNGRHTHTHRIRDPKTKQVVRFDPSMAQAHRNRSVMLGIMGHACIRASQGMQQGWCGGAEDHSDQRQDPSRTYSEPNCSP